jgi:hypothetical protein
MIYIIIERNVDMPGYDTHYLYGINSYRKLPNSNVKKAINANRGVYTLGLFGPDIFFYYATEVAAARKNIGSIMHTENTGIFFKYLIEYTEQKQGAEREIATAYLAGFLSHYSLDCVCHPYVYWKTDYLHKTKGYTEKHFSLETDIDIMLLKSYLNTTPYEFTKNSEIRLNVIQMPIVCDMLHYAIHKTYHDSRITRRGIKYAIGSIKKEQKIIRIASERLKNTVGRIEKYFVGQQFIAPLIPGGNEIKNKDPLNLNHEKWFNPWDMTKTYTLSVPEMLNKAREGYILTIFLLDSYLDENIRADYSYTALMNNIGSKSYHSGLNCRIPS